MVCESIVAAVDQTICPKFSFFLAVAVVVNGSDHQYTMTAIIFIGITDTVDMLRFKAPILSVKSLRCRPIL